MLFARAIWANDSRIPVEKIAEVDIARGYSWWEGKEVCTLPSPDHRISRGQRLPGLCAVCGANSYTELARKIEKDRRNAKGWLGGRIPPLAIFEGEPAGHDPEGWPIFIARKVLVIADPRAIRSI